MKKTEVVVSPSSTSCSSLSSRVEMDSAPPLKRKFFPDTQIMEKYSSTPFISEKVQNWSFDHCKELLENEHKEKDALQEELRQCKKRLKKMREQMVEEEEEQKKRRERINANQVKTQIKLDKLEAENLTLKKQCEKSERDAVEDPELVFCLVLHNVDIPEIESIPEKPNCYRVRYRYLKGKKEDKK